MDMWPEAEAHIQRIECLGVLLVLLTQVETLAGRDVLWFVDNTSVLGALLKGSTADTVVHVMCEVVHLFLFQTHTSVYFEWVESDANWADGVSRQLSKCPWAATQGFAVSELPEPAMSARSLEVLLVELAMWSGIGEMAGAALSSLSVALGSSSRSHSPRRRSSAGGPAASPPAP